MLKEILIKGINVKEPKKFSKDGKTWDSWPVGIVIENQQGQDEWINGLVNSHPQWQKGDKVTLEIWKDEKWGWKFKLPRQDDMLAQRLTALEARVSVLEGKKDGNMNNVENASIEIPF